MSLTYDTSSKNEHSRPEYNWWSKLSEFSFTRVHIAGEFLADTLSSAFPINSINSNLVLINLKKSN